MMNGAFAGLIAGAAGTAALNIVAYMDMAALRGSLVERGTIQDGEHPRG